MKATNSIMCSLLAMTLASGCGGGGGDSSSPSASTTSVSGSVFAAQVNGATVVVKDASGNVVAGPINTGSDGTYSISIPDSALSGDLVFESTGGTFTDEATGSTTNAGKVTAYAAAGSLNSGSAIHATPATTILQKLIAGGMTKSAAESAFNTAFGFTPDHTIPPTDATVSSATASESEKLAGLRAAAFSQLAKDLGLTPAQQFDLVAAIADDLADNSLDGKNGSATVNIVTGKDMPVDIQNRFGTAVTGFLNDTSKNKTGLASDKVGNLPFAKTALTDSYKVEYISVSPSGNAKAGKTVFKLKVTSLAGGNTVPGLTISLTPKMHMAGMSHTTTVESVIDNGDGTYTCTVYYLMASSMNGSSMGYWELKASIGSETAIFYPSVDMDMSKGTPKATLKGQSDVISNMSGSEKRSYYIYNDGISMSSTDHFFNLFITAKESMTSFPAVKVGTVMNSTLTVSSVTVEASLDGTTWVPATDEGNGHWKVGGIGLTHDYAGKVYIKATINGEQKTTDGNAPSGTNDYATFDLASMSMSDMTH